MCYFPEILSLELPNLYSQVNLIGKLAVVWKKEDMMHLKKKKKRHMTGIFNIAILIKLSILLALAVSTATVEIG